MCPATDNELSALMYCLDTAVALAVNVKPCSAGTSHSTPSLPWSLGMPVACLPSLAEMAAFVTLGSIYATPPMSRTPGIGSPKKPHSTP
ncbi:hypothetical protein D3C81_1867510 [compost metagenome]